MSSSGKPDDFCNTDSVNNRCELACQLQRKDRAPDGRKGTESSFPLGRRQILVRPGGKGAGRRGRQDWRPEGAIVELRNLSCCCGGGECRKGE